MSNKQQKTPAPVMDQTENPNPVKMPVVYDKAKLLTLDRYANRRDLLSALLEDGKEYTKDQVDGLIKDFMERKGE